ncbi:hypothetical protein [Streptacidiphilus sp. PAMC 29251]
MTASPKRKVRFKAPGNRFLTLDDLAAFIQDARRSGALGNEDISFDSRLWRYAFRKVSIEVDPTAAGFCASMYVGPPPEVAEALRRHFSPHDLKELARFLGTGTSRNRATPPRQPDWIKRTAVVECQAADKQILTLEDLAAFTQEATRLGACGGRCVDSEAKIFSCGLKRICVDVASTNAYMPLTVRLESPETTAVALRDSLRPGEVLELARLLDSDGPQACDAPAAADSAGQLSGHSRAEGAPMSTRKVTVEHQTVLTLTLDHVAVFIRDARRMGARGDETVKAGTPPRYHKQALWILSVEVALPPVDRLLRKVHTDRLTEAVGMVRRNLSPHDVLLLARLLATDAVPDSTMLSPAEGARRSSDPARGGKEPGSTRAVKIESSTPNQRLTLSEVATFVRDAAEAGAHGDATVTDPSCNYQLLSLCVEVDVEPLERLVRDVLVDRPSEVAKALRRTFDPHDIRELALLLPADGSPA